MITHARNSTLTSLMQFFLIGAVSIALIAVLFPIFEASHAARVHNVQSRLRELGSAMEQYSEDNDSLTPSGSFSFKVAKRTSLTGLGWAGQLYPYVRSTTVFDDAMGGAKNNGYGDVVAFGINENAARNEKPGTWNNRDKTVLLFQVYGAHAQVDQPNEGDCNGPGACSPAGNGTIIMFMDGLFPKQAAPATGDIGHRSVDNVSGAWLAPEIDGGSYYLLADGHVKWFRPSMVSSGSDALLPKSPQNGLITGHAAGTGDPHFRATFSTN